MYDFNKFDPASKPKKKIEEWKHHLHHTAKRYPCLEAEYKVVEAIEKLWEDILEEELEMHDMVFAANSLYRIKLIAPAVKKMLAMTKKYLCIIMTCKSTLYSNIWYRFKREEYHPPPSFLHLYNILCGLDIIANIKIINRKHCYIYRDLKQAMDLCNRRNSFC